MKFIGIILGAGMKTLIILLCVLAQFARAEEAPVAAPQGEQDWAQLAIQAQEMRQQAKQKLETAQKTQAEKDKACWQKFLVSACQEDARKELKAAEREVNQMQNEAGRIERRVREHERQQRMARKAEKIAAQQEKIAKREEEIRSKEEKQRQQVEKKQAEIQKRSAQPAK